MSVQLLVVGAILAPGKRTITSLLRVMGLSQEKHFQNYHRVLNRSVWSARAVSRVLLEISLVTVVAHHLQSSQKFKIRRAAWYAKPLPTFVDAFVEDVGGAIALVRQYLWPSTFSMSDSPTEMVKIPRALLERFTDTLGYAA